jgi:hypothetical protein
MRSKERRKMTRGSRVMEKEAKMKRKMITVKKEIIKQDVCI